MAYADLNTIQTFNPGDILTAAALQQVRDNGEFLIDPPFCAVYHSTTENTTGDGTPKTLAANSEQFDNDSMHSTTTNSSRITIQTAGRYELSATIAIQTNSTGYRLLGLVVNGATTYTLTTVSNAGNTVPTVITATRKLVLSAGDYVEVIARQNSTSTLTAELREFAAKFETR